MNNGDDVSSDGGGGSTHGTRILDLTPRSVACSRGNWLSGISYDAELAFDGKNYLISTGHPDMAAAKAAAQVEVNKIVNDFRTIALGYLKLHGFKEAKE